MAYWKSKNVLPAPTKFLGGAISAFGQIKTNKRLEALESGETNNEVGTEEGKGDNSGLIEALKKQDVAKQEVEKLKKDTESTNGNTNI